MKMIMILAVNKVLLCLMLALSVLIINQIVNVCHWTGIHFYISSVASKPINIRWITTSSQPYYKTMYSIVLEITFHE